MTRTPDKSWEISVVIPTMNRPGDLAVFLDSLDQQTRLPDEFIAVDASQNVETKDLLDRRKTQANYEITRIPAKPGSARQRNIGAEAARGKYLFFFDDDTELEPEYLQVAMRTFADLEGFNVGGLMGYITNDDPDASRFNRVFRNIFFLTHPGPGRLKPSHYGSLNMGPKMAWVNILPGCHCAFLRKVFDDFQFDERLTGYSYLEDVDFSFRVSKKYRLVYQPRARLAHYPTTFKTADSRKLRAMMVRHQFYLFKKNMPKDLYHLYALVMSVLGLLITNGLLQRDLRACLGILEGLATPIRKRGDL